ncbi:hypothetical protein D3C80_1585760 [compost metagenome]
MRIESITIVTELIFVYLVSSIPEPPNVVIADAVIIGFKKSTARKSSAPSIQPPRRSPNRVLISV